jgi:hypothetical protein
LYNADIRTLDLQKPKVELIAIKSNKILALGESSDLDLFRGRETKLIDCEGKTIVPGFNDAHCHPLAFAASLLSIDCGPSSVKSIAELQARIRQKAEQFPCGTWIKATGYNEFYFAEKRHPTRWDLDKVTPYHPVKLVHQSGHACVLNSLALKLVGISMETPEPPGGLIDRDLKSGEPNGILFGMNDYVEKKMPPPSWEELERGVRLANQEYLSHGITSVQDATWGDSLNRWQVFQQLKERGELDCRVSMMVGVNAWEEFRKLGLSSGSGDSQLRLGGVKMVIEEASGELFPPQGELNQMVLQAHKGGFQLALHAIEESSVTAATIALEYALAQAPKVNHRHRVEHCSVCPPYLMQRLKKIQAMIVTQPPFIYYNGERYLETVSDRELKRLYPIGSLLKMGLKVAASSDSPVVPLSPLVGIYTAITRNTQTGQAILPQEGVPHLAALKMYTLDAAYASFEEKSKGSLTPGKLADLLVLSDDPLEVPLEKIKEIQPVMTIIDGKVVWERN